MLNISRYQKPFSVLTPIPLDQQCRQIDHRLHIVLFRPNTSITRCLMNLLPSLLQCVLTRAINRQQTLGKASNKACLPV